MKHLFQFILDSRKAFIALVDDLTTEQLNTIPPGFNNNIIWNFGHIVVSTQALCYVRSGVRTDASFIPYLPAYVKGTKPSYTVQEAEILNLKTQALESINRLERDFEDGIFAGFQPFETATYKSTLHSIEEVILTTAGHDNLHFGYAIAQKKHL